MPQMPLRRLGLEIHLLPNMIKNKNTKGIVFTCHPNGQIKTVNLNELFPETENLIGKSFPALLEPDDIPKGLNFIHDINTKQYSFGYYLNFRINKQVACYYFIGLKLDDELLIIGSENHQEAFILIGEMQRINNEQSNVIRKLIKEKFVPPTIDYKEIQALFDEITRINNELVNLQRELTQKNAELERLNSIKSSFIGMAAHDLRDPLGVIQNYAEFLAEQASENLTENQRWMLEVIQKSAQFMLGLIEDLLDYNKIESGKFELLKSTISLTTTVERWIAIQSDIAKRKRIGLTLIAPDDDIIIEADIHKLEQVFNNLISNAVKFSFPESEITVTLAVEKNFAILSVKDQGIGMSSEQLDKLFKPFTQIVAEGTAGEKCTGLGLSIVKKILEGHGGRIEVSSTPNKGTEFVMYMPLKDKKSVPH